MGSTALLPRSDEDSYGREYGPDRWRFRCPRFRHASLEIASDGRSAYCRRCGESFAAAEIIDLK